MFCPKKHNHSFVHLHILLCHSPDSLIQRQTLAGSDITRNKKSLVFLLQVPASTTAFSCNAIDALMQHTINTTVFFSTRALMQRDIKRNCTYFVPPKPPLLWWGFFTCAGVPSKIYCLLNGDTTQKGETKSHRYEECHRTMN